MRLAIVQLDSAWQDPGANFARVEALVEEACPHGVDLVCLPEMFATGFSMDVAAVAEPPEGPTFQFLAGLARRHRAWVLGTMPELGPEGPGGLGLNASLVFDREGRLQSRYHKMHTFTPGGETRHYQRGSFLPVFELEGLTAATPLCYDLRFPELFRNAMFRGANLFLHAANWPTSRVHHWRALMVARAIENLSWVVGINRVGDADGIAYPGHSIVVSPSGEILLETDEREQVALFDLDPSAVTQARERFRFLHDVRPDCFPDVFNRSGGGIAAQFHDTV